MKTEVNILNHRLSLFFTVLFLQSICFGKIFYWPEACDSGQLRIKNSGSQNISVWLQKFSAFLESESEFIVKAHSSAVIKTEKRSEEDRFSLITFFPASLKITYECAGTNYPVSDVDGGRTIFEKHKSGASKIWIRNIFPGPNTIKIELLSGDNDVLESTNVKIEKSGSFLAKLSETKIWNKLRLSSSHKYSAFLIGDSVTLAPNSVMPFAVPAETSGYYFLIGPRTGDADSFVVKITDSEMAEKARHILKNPGTEKIVLAKIKKDHGDFNRNFSSPNAGFWSWSASEVTGYGDFGSTSCNGNPQMLEDRVESWIENPGQICFWSYRIKQELSAESVATGILPSVKKP